MSKKRRGGTEKIKLKTSEIISNGEAVERIRNIIICAIPEPSFIVYHEEGEEIIFPNNTLVLIRENGEYKIFTIPNENFRNAFVSKNITRKNIEMMKEIEKEKSTRLQKTWFGKNILKKKKDKHNPMYV